MMEINERQPYILSPLVRFRKEKHRCIAYTVDEFFHSVDHLSILYPQEVIFLLLFDGTKAMEEIGRDYCYLFSIECNEAPSLAKAMVDTLSKRMGGFFPVVPLSSVTSAEARAIAGRYDARSFIMNRNDVHVDFGDLRLESPLSVNFNVMTSCGFHCRYCYHPLVPIGGYISLDRLRTLFAELKDLGCESLLLTGGDPMLRPDIDKIMVALHEAGLFYTLSTKSILDAGTIAYLVDRAGLDRIQLSLDSFKPDLVESLVGPPFPRYSERFSTMIGDLQRAGIDIRLKCVATSLNIADVTDYLDRAVDLGIRHIQIVAYGRSGMRHRDILFPSRLQQEKATDDIALWRERHEDVDLVGGDFSCSYEKPYRPEAITDETIFSKRVICNAGRFALLMLPNGEVSVCEHLPYDPALVLGDLKKQGIMECWNGPGMKAWLSPPDRSLFGPASPCRSCPQKYYDRCHIFYSRCLRYCREIWGKTEMPDRNCPYADFRERRIT